MIDKVKKRNEEKQSLFTKDGHEYPPLPEGRREIDWISMN